MDMRQKISSNQPTVSKIKAVNPKPSVLVGVKPGDMIYITPLDNGTAPRLEKVEKVGRLFLQTVSNNQFALDTGIERRSTKRRDWRPTCRAYASKDQYDRAFNHTIRLLRIRRSLAELKASDFTEEDLINLETLIQRASIPCTSTSKT